MSIAILFFQFKSIPLETFSFNIMHFVSIKKIIIIIFLGILFFGDFNIIKGKIKTLLKKSKLKALKEK